MQRRFVLAFIFLVGMPLSLLAHSTHEMFNVDTDKAPAFELDVMRDPVSGWNVNLKTHNFKFAPQSAGVAHKVGEGHAHLYVDGEKVARVYGEWFHLPNLGKGQHTIEVTLNTNMHDDYAVNHTRIKKQVVISE